MFIAYVLHSKQFDKIYVGFTSDLESRLLSHNALSTKGYTKKYRPWTLILSEEFSTKAEALKRESEYEIKVK